MYDAIIVGARCAGSPTAMLLARKGHKVLLVDKAAFPSDTMSTHLMHLPAVHALKEWGVYDHVMASGAPPLPEVTMEQHGIALQGAPPSYEDTDHWLCPRRTILDNILVDAARNAGAEVRENFSVSEVVFDGDAVVGIRGRDKDSGKTVEERAKVVIGADGRNSLVAKAVDAPRYHEVPPLLCAYYSYFEGVENHGFEFYVTPDAVIGLFATNDGLACVFTEWAHNRFAEYRSDVEGNYMKTLDLVPEFGQRVRAGKRVERFTGTQDLPNFFRKPYGEGWALVGDAGYHKDPLTGQGIRDAFRDAKLLAAALDNALSGVQPYEDAMAAYQAGRDEETMGGYMMTTQIASLQPPPEPIASVLKALPENAEHQRQFLGVVAGSVAFGDFFAPDNMARITGQPVAA